ncbi:MAG: NnrS family protein [Steroidobacteraceae bacterium]
MPLLEQHPTGHKAMRACERAPTTAVFTYGFRPFFLAAGGWASIAIGLWLAVVLGYLHLPTRFDPVAWHIHEMLFGVVLAAVAGFLLTAIASWTGRPSVSGRSLALLLVLWAFGRLACLESAYLPLWQAAAADMAFPVALLAVVARELVGGPNWRNLPMLVPIAVFITADLLMHLEVAGAAIPDGLGWRLGLVAALQLISIVGGRIIPSFTRNWLTKRGQARLPPVHGPVDTIAIGVLHAALLLWALIPAFRAAGLILILAAVLNLWRLSRWVGGATLSEPLVFILHVGYAWLAIGVALLGFSVAGASVPIASALHALTVGAIGTMLLAVMTRVSLGHTGRVLSASPATVCIFVLVNTAALVRVAASWSATATTTFIVVSGLCWIAAFGWFEVRYSPVLLAPRITPH